MNQSPAQVARLFFYLLDFRFRSARFGALAPSSLSASASVSLLCIPLSWCLAAFLGALRFLQNRAPRGATRESILRALEYVKRFFIGRTASCEAVFYVFPRGDEIKNFYFS